MRSVATGDVPSRQLRTDQPSETVSIEAAFDQAGSLHVQGRLDQAEQLYRAILQADRTHIGSLHNLGILYFQRGQYDNAVALTREVVRLRPDLPVAHNTLGVALRHLGRLEEAEACCHDALRLQPQYAEAHNTLGDVLTAQRRWNEAEACCREALRLQPDYAEAHNNLGTILTALDRLEEAEICYREALRLKPGNVPALNNLATVLLRLDRPQEAEACCREALRLKPGDAEALNNLAIVLAMQQKMSEAAACLGRAAALKPNDADMLIGWFYRSQEICDWSHFDEGQAGVRNAVGEQRLPGTAWNLLMVASTPEEQLAHSRRIAATIAIPKSATFPSPPPRPSERLRLGYFSANFHFHPAATLIAGLIEQHDRRRFEVIGYGFDEDDGSAIRRRLVAAFDRFVDISEMLDCDAAELIHADTIDILVDVHGWTMDSRAKILAYRPAPIQVNYLDHPCTTGADFIDYIVVDRFVVPPEQQCFFSERVVYLPDCYQCNDHKREIAGRTPSRGECGLPERGFVFCCFNMSWKLTPGFFDIWMRLLRAVPDSVLWLYEANPLMKANLAREAEARGVAPERLVFAPRLSQAEHLARYRLADLFLDTLPFNAHTSASDTLWAGLPVLTCAGNTFAGRVAGSLLRAVGLPELVATSLEEYEALAIRLACAPDRLARLRARLAQNRRTCPLFNTGRFTRHIEAAYWRMHEIRRGGRPPTAFSVAPSREVSEAARAQNVI